MQSASISLNNLPSDSLCSLLDTLPYLASRARRLMERLHDAVLAEFERREDIERPRQPAALRPELLSEREIAEAVPVLLTVSCDDPQAAAFLAEVRVAFEGVAAERAAARANRQTCRSGRCRRA